MKVVVLLSNRCTYTRQQVMLEKMNKDKDIDLHLILTGALLEEQNGIIKDIRESYNSQSVFIDDYNGLFDGMAKSIETLSGGFLKVIKKLNLVSSNDMCMCIADRFELLPFANIVSYLNIPLAHIQAFERSGNIDDKVRDAVSALSDVHFTSHYYALDRGLDMGYRNIYTTGCPSIDFCKRFENEPKGEHVLFMYHPVTTDLDNSVKDTTKILEQVSLFCGRNNLKLYVFASNNDPGYLEVRDLVLKNINNAEYIYNIKGEDFYRLLASSQMIVGNSSAGIREASYFGVKAVNIGERQQNRVHGPNVIHCGSDGVLGAMWKDKAIFKSTLFGTGDASDKIIKIIKGESWRRRRK
jgi:UDP-hydrolysing UDP-N-acetyl-D-glucosamine 2-epimerase